MQFYFRFTVFIFLHMSKFLAPEAAQGIWYIQFDFCTNVFGKDVLRRSWNAECKNDCVSFPAAAAISYSYDGCISHALRF